MSSPLTIIAIDGPSASGKGTVAKKLAAHFDFAHLDTGLLYRAVGLAVLKSGGEPDDAAAAEQAAKDLAAFYLLENKETKRDAQVHSPTREEELVRFLSAFDFANIINDPALRGDAASFAASRVAAIPAVRAALLKFQQDFCAKPPLGKQGAVLDGRDIGTVIAPHAKVKIFVTASVEIRADRRMKELQGRGENVNYEAILKDMQERDARDASRAIAPSKPADDAVLLDTTSMTAGQAFDEAVKIVKEKLDK